MTSTQQLPLLLKHTNLTTGQNSESQKKGNRRTGQSNASVFLNWLRARREKKIIRKGHDETVVKFDYGVYDTSFFA